VDTKQKQDIMNPNNNDLESLQTYIETLESPTLLMQGQPRQVVTANKKACALFGKDLTQIEGYRGGQVFDCIHSFTEAGCGLDINCENCTIKTAIVETFTTEKSYSANAVLDIKKANKINPFNIQVSTEKVGDFALINIDNYKKI